MSNACALSDQSCAPCNGNTPALTEEEVSHHMHSLKDWQLMRYDNVPQDFIYRKIKFKNFLTAMLFVNAVAELAESEGHHPDIEIKYNYVALSIYTHAVRALSINDFILAAKIDKLLIKEQ